MSPGMFTAIAVVVLAVLVWLLVRFLNQDKLEELMNKRKAEARIVGRGELAEGMQRFPVALAVCGSTLYYENADLQAEVDLNRIDEVEYAHELVTGREVEPDVVLRLRSHGHPVEFILSPQEADRWKGVLPAKVNGEGGMQQAHATA